MARLFTPIWIAVRLTSAVGPHFRCRNIGSAISVLSAIASNVIFLASLRTLFVTISLAAYAGG
ncbi:unannotated protein [freshwater metagenome]|uniref:Unannotated protein n=1 Tax=freshwater metagenome TaxID=449393 RepID=A0A6J6CPC2_9ZZZZ